MRAAQSLYENGFITYMRTDSTNLSEQALAAARRAATELFGADYVPEAPRTYAKKVKNAQEAHEAIRPAGDTFRHPDEVRGSGRRRSGPRLRADLEAHGRVANGRRRRLHGFGASRRWTRTRTRSASSRRRARVITFPGYQRVYVEGSDDDEADSDNERVLPPLAEGDARRRRVLHCRSGTTRSRRPASPRRR